MKHGFATLATLAILTACGESPSQPRVTPPTQPEVAQAVARVANVTQTYTSGSHVTAWGPIYQDFGANWPATACTAQPPVTLNDSRWGTAHNATAFGLYAHPWQNYSKNASARADWINAWSNINSTGGPGAISSGHNWSKYETPVAGNGSFVLSLLADNCSWVYLDGTLVGTQLGGDAAQQYGVTLNGTHTLTFMIFDGGGLAGGMYRMETTTNPPAPLNPDLDSDGHLNDADAYPLDPTRWQYETTTTVSFSGPVAMYTGLPFTATATVSPSGATGATTIAYTDCTNAGTCTATATFVGTGLYAGSTGAANLTITKATSTTTVSFGAGPFVFTGSAFTATAVSTAATSLIGGPVIAYTGDCTNGGVTCTAAANYAGDVNHTGSQATANITITYAVCAAKGDGDDEGEGDDRGESSKGVEAGSTIPVKLRVCDARGRNISSRSLVVKAVSVSPTGSLNDSGKSNPGNLFRLDDGTYMFNLSTKGLAVGPGTLDYMIGGDPTVYHYAFTIRASKGEDKSKESKKH